MEQINIKKHQIVKCIGKTSYGRGTMIEILRCLDCIVLNGRPFSMVSPNLKTALKYYPENELIQINAPKFKAYYKQISLPRKICVRIS